MFPCGEPIPGVDKIAVLRANAIGDFLFALPALEALKAAYPRAELVLLGHAWHSEFLAGRPGPVDRVVVVPSCWTGSGGWNPETSQDEMETFLHAMQAERFDLAIQMHGGGKNSNPFVRRLGARVTAGLRTPDAEGLDRNLPFVYFQPEISRYLEVAALAGARPLSFEPRLSVMAQDRWEADSVIQDDGRALAVLHPGATDPRRRWPVESFARVGDALASAGARVLVTGGRSEHHLVRSVLEAMHGTAEDLCSQLTLRGLAGLLSLCKLIVSNDTGPLHLGAAVGAATVGIYWCFNLYNSSELTRSCNRQYMSWRMNCPVCGAHCTDCPCDHSVSFVADVPADEVCQAALEFLVSDPRETGRIRGGRTCMRSTGVC